VAGWAAVKQRELGARVAGELLPLRHALDHRRDELRVLPGTGGHLGLHLARELGVEGLGGGDRRLEPAERSTYGPRSPEAAPEPT